MSLTLSALLVIILADLLWLEGELAANFGTIVLALVTLATAAVALQQYSAAQKWQKARILNTLIDSFMNNIQVQAACKMFDWDQREISFKDGTIQFTNDKLLTALETPLRDEEDYFKQEGRMIRDALDAFFDFFEKLRALERAKLLRFKDFSYFYYYLDMVHDLPKNKYDLTRKMTEKEKQGILKKRREMKKRIDEYLTNYNFRGFRELEDEYERSEEKVGVSRLLGIK